EHPVPAWARFLAPIRAYDQRLRAGAAEDDRRDPRDVSAVGWDGDGARRAEALHGRGRADRGAIIRLCSTRGGGRVRLVAAVLKTVRVARPSGVQIPPPPPF